MKNKTNLFLFISFVVACMLTGWLFYLSGKRVGDLAVDEQQDGEFQVCNEDRIFQYYNLGTDYKGGKKAIKKEILSKLEGLDFNNPGLITARFVVNCNGDTGRFRYKSTDLDLKEMKVNSENIEKIKSAVLLLQHWNSPEENKVFDSYYVLNFKIRNNKIVDIF